jgi:hypothetical protein
VILQATYQSAIFVQCLRDECCARLTPCVWPTSCLCVLQSLSAQLRSRELSLADAEAQLAAKDEALAAAGQETANMHKVGITRCAYSTPSSCQLMLWLHAWQQTRVSFSCALWPCQLPDQAPSHPSCCPPVRPWLLWTVSAMSWQLSWMQPGRSTAHWRRRQMQGTGQQMTSQGDCCGVKVPGCCMSAVTEDCMGCTALHARRVTSTAASRFPQFQQASFEIVQYCRQLRPTDLEP